MVKLRGPGVSECKRDKRDRKLISTRVRVRERGRERAKEREKEREKIGRAHV